MCYDEGVYYQRTESQPRCPPAKVITISLYIDINKIENRLKLSLRALLASMNPNAKTAADTSCTECCICLNALSPLQPLFLAPCSHCFHYRCIVPLLGTPSCAAMFQCPLCRQVANLDASVVEDDDTTAALTSSADADAAVENAKTARDLEDWFKGLIRETTFSTKTSATVTAYTATTTTTNTTTTITNLPSNNELLFLPLTTGPFQFSSDSSATKTAAVGLPEPPMLARVKTLLGNQCNSEIVLPQPPPPSSTVETPAPGADSADTYYTL